MTAPHPTRFSFATFAMLLFALGATPTTRAQTTSAPTQTPAPAQSQPQPPQKKVWTNDNVGGSHSQQNDASAPAQQNSNSTSTARQNQRARKTRSGITIRSQSCRRRYRLSIKRLPNCRPRLMARRSTSRCTTARIESATGKSNCRFFRRSVKTRSTKFQPSKTKHATTASQKTPSHSTFVAAAFRPASFSCLRTDFACSHTKKSPESQLSLGAFQPSPKTIHSTWRRFVLSLDSSAA